MYPYQQLSQLVNLRYCFLHRRVILCRLFIRHANILQHLRIDLQRLSRLAHGQLLGQHYFHHLQTGQDAVIGAGVLPEDDINYYFSSIRMLSSMSVNILVAYLFLQYK